MNKTNQMNQINPSRQSRVSRAAILLRDDGGRTMDRRCLRAFLTFFKAKDDVSPVIQFIECETLQRVLRS